MTVDELLGKGPVIPVTELFAVDTATAVARALLAGGVHTIEVTLRTRGALEAIRRIAEQVPDIVVGAGTLLGPSQVTPAVDAGAQFLVSPGQSPPLLDEMQSSGLPFLVGCSSPSDLMVLVDRGIHAAKLFPAAAIGGPAMARALAGPFPDIKLCPTGGITQSTAGEYLSLRNVSCVGGSWLASSDCIGRNDWTEITRRARSAAELRHSH